ncbi:unnamed protein product, partial [Timema podura]|nr:unnamed protein product [Timema podura]
QSQDFPLIDSSCSAKVQLISTSSALPEIFSTGEPIKTHISAHVHMRGTERVIRSSLNANKQILPTCLRLNLTELHTKGDVVISSEDGTENSPIVITSLDIDFTLEGFKANFANILGGGAAGDLINSIINDNGLDIISQYKEEIRSFISKTFIGFANERLQSYTLKEILDYLGVIRSSRAMLSKEKKKKAVILRVSTVHPEWGSRCSGVRTAAGCVLGPRTFNINEHWTVFATFRYWQISKDPVGARLPWQCDGRGLDTH